MAGSGNHLIDALREAAASRPAAPFATDVADGLVTTYGALWEGAARVASALAAEGVVPGDRVAMQVAKSVAALQCYLGTVMAGAVHLPLNPALTAPETGHVLADAAPRVFVRDPADAGDPQGATILTLDANGEGTLACAAAASTPMPAPVARGPDDLAALLYTSGTTGRPKGAMLTHGNLVSNARTLAALWRFDARDVLVHALPLFHVHGLFVAVHVTLVAGGAIRLHRGFDARAVIADLGHATAMMGVPTHYVRLLAEPGLTREAVAGMRLFVSGSAPMLEGTHALWRDRTGHAVLERYGMTEAGMITSNPYEGPRKPGTVGPPLPGVEVRLAGADGAPPLPGAPGGIEVRGPNVFAGYWNLPERTAEELGADGWFRTGDVGVVDADGYYAIVGRARDMVVTGGFNVYPREIEALADTIPGVAETAAFGVPDPDLGEVVALAVVAAAGAAPGEEAIRAALAQELARYKQPRRIHLVEALPRNAMGKVQKAALRATFGGA